MQEAHWSLFRRFAGGELLSREDIANNPDLSNREITSLRDAFDYLESQFFIAADTYTGTYQSSKFKLTKRGKEAFDMEFNDRFQKKQNELRWQFFQDPQSEIIQTGSRGAKPPVSMKPEMQAENSDSKKSAGNRNMNLLGSYAFFMVVTIVVLVMARDRNTAPMIEKQALSLDRMAGTIKKIDSTLKVIVADDLKRGPAGLTKSREKNNN